MMGAALRMDDGALMPALSGQTEDRERRRLAAALDLRTGSLCDGRALVAEALTDCDAANATLRSIASHIRTAVLGDSEMGDREIGRIVREAVIRYARAPG